jgi:hypothetical protein
MKKPEKFHIENGASLLEVYDADEIDAWLESVEGLPEKKKFKKFNWGDGVTDEPVNDELTAEWALGFNEAIDDCKFAIAKEYVPRKDVDALVEACTRGLQTLERYNCHYEAEQLMKSALAKFKEDEDGKT